MVHLFGILILILILILGSVRFGMWLEGQHQIVVPGKQSKKCKKCVHVASISYKTCNNCCHFYSSLFKPYVDIK